MGPIVILDKSAFQSLSNEELGFLSKHYTVNIPPIMVLDVLADLKQDVVDRADSQDRVAGLVEKLSLWESRLNVHYKALCMASLLGHEIAMTGMPVLLGGRVVQPKDGREGMVSNETNEQEAIRLWREQCFMEAESLLETRWREISQNLADPSWFRKSLATQYIIIPKVSSIRGVSKSVDSILTNANLQTELLQWFMTLLALPAAEQDVVTSRWAQRRTPFLRDWAPYAFFCIKVMFTIYTAASYKILGSGLTDFIDMEYLFYLPFCMAFCSGSKLHAQIAPMLLNPQQDFVTVDELKTDLHLLATEWKNLSKEEKEDRTRDRGNCPPQNEKSITSRLWQKHMKPREPGSGNGTVQLTMEQEQETLECIRLCMDAMDVMTGKDNEPQAVQERRR
jgi:hypothetical protein